MQNAGFKGLKLKSVFFYGAVFISLVIIVYYLLNPKPKADENTAQAVSTSITENTIVESKTRNDVSEEIESESDAASDTTNQEKESAEGEDNSNTSNAVTQDKQTLNTETKAEKPIKEDSQAKQPEINNTKKTESKSLKQVEASPVS